MKTILATETMDIPEGDTVVETAAAATATTTGTGGTERWGPLRPSYLVRFCYRVHPSLEGVYLRLWSSRVRLFRFVFIVVVAHLCF
uniref:Uncharacterized protein n=1 Tax=Zea mays TaxID=4577 RepID=B6TX14_MAIZE|nr:hypothetical protein [Zea mays]